MYKYYTKFYYTNTFRQYRKDFKPPVYIKNSLNYPPHIKKELPRINSKRITQFSSNKDIFEEVTLVINSALKNYKESAVRSLNFFLRKNKKVDYHNYVNAYIDSRPVALSVSVSVSVSVSPWIVV